MNVAKVAAAGVIGTIALGVFVFSQPQGQTPSGQGQKSLLAQAVKPGITMAKYQAAKEGMTLEAARKVMGAPGQESATSGTMAMHVWSNWDGSSVSATFERGRLVSKAQMGLH